MRSTCEDLSSYIYARLYYVYLKSQASAFALFTASTESGKVGFGIRWRTLEYGGELCLFGLDPTQQNIKQT